MIKRTVDRSIDPQSSTISVQFASERHHFAAKLHGPPNMKRFICLCLLLMTSSGCAGLLHELQPHRLWRMNYQESSGRMDGAFLSLSDPLDEPVPELEQTSKPVPEQKSAQ
ncbi:MAG: hypothetical protein WBH50_00600 [Fuerstiella sp.]